MSEFLDIVNENGLPTGRIVERSIAHMEGDLAQDIPCLAGAQEGRDCAGVVAETDCGRRKFRRRCTEKESSDLVLDNERMYHGEIFRRY